MNDLEMFAGLESTAHFAWIESSVSTCSLLFFFKIGRSTPRSAAADTCEETDYSEGHTPRKKKQRCYDQYYSAKQQQSSV